VSVQNKTPFQRINPNEVTALPESMRDNSYVASDQAGTGWGAKANNTLIQVKGKGFRHEKTKKKRGSYRGGALPMEPQSLKFADDD
jgi:hypothetical protein